uniref:Uncharacterized protein n=1 Tax=Anopheles funestus TaxID=62324 RepID=A0A3F2YXR2_ANOFN
MKDLLIEFLYALLEFLLKRLDVYYLDGEITPAARRQTDITGIWRFGQ